MKRFNKIIFTTITLVFILVSVSFAASTNGTGWVKSGKDWMYKKNGTILKGRWMTIDGQPYYFTSDGIMATGVVKIGNYYHIFDANGVPYPTNGNFDINGKKYVISGNGKIEGIELEQSDTWLFKFNKELDKNSPSAKEKKAFTITVTDIYNSINTDKVNRIIVATVDGFDFMNAYNLMLNEIRNQVKTKQDEMYQFAKLGLDDAKSIVALNEYKAVIAEYKALSQNIFNQLVVIFNPKENTKTNALAKLDKYYEDQVERYEDRLDTRLERQADLDDTDDE